jgi:hypothetical protein
LSGANLWPVKFLGLAFHANNHLLTDTTKGKNGWGGLEAVPGRL